MICSYCKSRKVEKVVINWEGLKGYPICSKCIKDLKAGRLESHFIKEQIEKL